MSKIEFDPGINLNGKRGRITKHEGNFFCLIQTDQGAEVSRQNYNSGASWAYGVLGPDLKRPGSQQTNTPNVNKAGFTSGWVGTNKPSSIFLTNRFNGDSWKLGHMINGAWGGSGRSWLNLTPLTHTSNMNHKTIEGHMNNFLSSSYTYEANSNNHRPYWYGIEYLVECSVAPFAANLVNVSTNLYAYAPEFIRVTWRAIRILKPTNRTPNQIPTYLDNYVIQSVQNIPFNFPNFPGNLRNNGALPQGNVRGGNAINSGIQLVQARANNFDGSCDIFQF